jgi:uncharacterized membrane protein YeaQ/YmgE (transglycosylase-associated protein family)
LSTQPARQRRAVDANEEALMGIIAWIVLGAVAGISAERMTGKRSELFPATVVGIVGALLGGWLATVAFQVHTLNSFFNLGTSFFNLGTWITAIVGAIALLLAVRALNNGRSRRGHARLLGWRHLRGF